MFKYILLRYLGVESDGFVIWKDVVVLGLVVVEFKEDFGYMLVIFEVIYDF